MNSKYTYDIWTSPNSGIGGDGSVAISTKPSSVRIALGNNRGFALVDAEDEAMVRAAGPWHLLKKESRNSSYAIAHVYKGKNKRTTCRMHCVIIGPVGELEIHHINFDGLDNRRENLEVLTKSQHQLRHAHKLRKDNVSGTPGVSWVKASKKWRVRISINGKSLLIGIYSDKNEAISARMEALRSVRAGIHPKTGERIAKVVTS